ncbi:hypothetical protein NDN08_008341 [Rhodosorus marinus]|uniref:Tic20 family protein Ycf60 n=1 Tax=Rhodosorus marinus TaxID=101924 RepID=A0AAV8V052_9RHOD|nr:hypothetical protein NDN08_008341 [Rhodosorus marinus]
MSYAFVSGFGGLGLRSKAGVVKGLRDSRRDGNAVHVVKRSVKVSMSYNDGKPEGKDRFFSILPYFLPLLDSLQYGSYLFQKFPVFKELVLYPLAPFYSIYRGIPFLDLAIFFGVFFLVVRNTNINRFIRYNAQQAIMLDLILIIPALFGGAAAQMPRFIAETGANTVFYSILAAVGYAVIENIRGELPNKIPLVSESVDSQIGPF